MTTEEGKGNFTGFNLDARLQKAVAAAGYDTPTPIQLQAIPLCLQRRDLIATAQTGTGKTAAFVLPMLQHLLDNPGRGRTRALILTPTRELAEQINESILQLGRFTAIRSATVYGGIGMLPQQRALRGGAEIIVACPGRLLDHMGRGNTDFGGISSLVLDEADRMLDMGFLPSIKRILAALPRERQTLLFSATFAPELNKLAASALRSPERLDIDLRSPAKTVTHVLYTCSREGKAPLLLELLKRTDTESVLIFTRTKHRANRLVKQIAGDGHTATVLHSNKSQNQRKLALDDFRSGKCQILVATDIAARGLDVAGISHVINFDIPDTVDAYIHRIGRTGRAQCEGDAFTLVTGEDAAAVAAIEKAIGRRIERRRLEEGVSEPTVGLQPGRRHKAPSVPAGIRRPQCIAQGSA